MRGIDVFDQLVFGSMIIVGATPLVFPPTFPANLYSCISSLHTIHMYSKNVFYVFNEDQLVFGSIVGATPLVSPLHLSS